MSSLTGTFRKYNVQKRARTAYLSFDGNIDAETQPSFSSTVKQILDGSFTWLIVDLYDVEYINSSGLGVLVNARDRLRDRGGGVILTRVDKNVGQVMNMLGLTSFFPMYARRTRALKHVARAEVDDDAGVEDERDGPTAKFIDRRSRSIPDDARVFFFVENNVDAFLDTVQLRLSGADRSFFVFDRFDDGREKLDEMKPDLIVLEDRLPGADDFVMDVRTRTEHSLVPMIRLYDEGERPGDSTSFYVWENDSLIEPFDLMQLFSLAEAELVRVRPRKEVFLQHLHYSFTPEGDNRDRAESLGRDVIRTSGLDGEGIAELEQAFLEAVDNAIVHGIQENPDRRVEIEFLLKPDQISMRVEYDGYGFDYEEQLRRAENMDAVERTREQQDEGEGGGLGMKLMLECTDELTYVDPGNSVRMTKYIGEASGNAGGN